MRLIRVGSAFLIILCSFALLPAQDAKTPAEAAPVVALLKAVKKSDVAGFRDAFCKQLREDKQKGDWNRNLKEVQTSFHRLFADYELDEFRFAFVGDKEKGKVAVTHKGKASAQFFVIKEDQKWKLDGPR